MYGYSQDTGKKGRWFITGHRVGLSNNVMGTRRGGGITPKATGCLPEIGGSTPPAHDKPAGKSGRVAVDKIGYRDRQPAKQ